MDFNSNEKQFVKYLEVSDELHVLVPNTNNVHFVPCQDFLKDPGMLYGKIPEDYQNSAFGLIFFDELNEAYKCLIRRQKELDAQKDLTDAMLEFLT